MAEAVKQEEAAAVAAGVLAIELGDAGARGLQDVGILRLRLGGGIRKVAEQGEMNPRVDVAERLDLEVRDQLLDALRRCRAGSAR